MKKIAVIVFPGTNCDRDTKWAFEQVGCEVEFVWHQEDILPKDTSLVVIPGGFSYGDYLRSGSIARFSPVMKEVVRHANNGGYVLGICNGFQILLEASLLEGAMKKNKSIHFVSKHQNLKVTNKNNKFLENLNVGDILNIPIAHGEGNYYADEKLLQKLTMNNQILLEYCDENANANNPNGSVANIAGVCNEQRNVFGLMPHPERAMQEFLGSKDGVKMLEGFAS